AFLIVEDVEAYLRAVVTRIKDETVRVDDRCGAEVLPVGPEHGARRGARGAENALRGVVETLTVFNRLHALFTTLGRVAGNEERLHGAVGVEERLHVYDEVLFKGKALDCLDVDRLGDVKILDQGLARQTVLAVD